MFINQLNPICDNEWDERVGGWLVVGEFKRSIQGIIQLLGDNLHELIIMEGFPVGYH